MHATLGVIDAFSRECLAIEVDTGFASRVTKECAFCAISVIRNIKQTEDLTAMNKHIIAALAILAALTPALAAPAAHARCVPTPTQPCVQTTDAGGTITTEKAPPTSAVRVAGAEAAGVEVMIAGTLTLDEVLKHWKIYDIMTNPSNPLHSCVVSKYDERKQNHEKVHGRGPYNEIVAQCVTEVNASNAVTKQK
jgi:hypothetical protein